MKTCPSCKETKSITEYWKNQCYCIPCHKEKQRKVWNSRSPKRRLEQHLKYKYSFSFENFQVMWEEQKGNCAICSLTLPDLLIYEDRRRGYAIDHNHDTGEVRGILCLNCNSLLGLSGDNPKVLESAINYLNNKGSYSLMNASKKKGGK